MNAKALLDQLLASGPKSDLGKYGAGAAAGSVLTLLLGTQRGRSMGGGLAKYGGMAALGVMAWKAYEQWQRSQVAPTGAAAGASAAPLPAGGFASLPAPAQDLHGRAMLKALIAAAKSDGHLDDDERRRVDGELQRLEAMQGDPGLRQWVAQELQRPLDPADVAAAATSPEMAAEVYLTSVAAVGTMTPMERLYLDALAQALKLPPGLRSALDAQAVGAGG